MHISNALLCGVYVIDVFMAYMAPRPKMIAMEILVWGFIFTSHNKNTGRMPNVQSAAALTAECA